MPTLVSSYEQGVSAETFIFDTNLTIASQSFTLSSATSTPLYSAKFWLFKYGAPTGNAYVKIFNVSGPIASTTPSGSAIATSDPINVASLPTSATLTEVLFTGSNAITLPAGNYSVGIEFIGGTITNCIAVSHAISNTGSAPGSSSFYKSPTWTLFNSGDDTSYYLYTADPVVAVPKVSVHSVDTNLRVQPDTTTYSFVYPGGWGIGYVGEQYGGLGSEPFILSYTRTHTLDTFKKKRLTRTHTVDTFKRKTNIRTHTVNTFLKKAYLKSHTVDTLLRNRYVRTHTIDSILKKSTTTSHSIDTFLVKRNTRTHTLDTFIRNTYAKSHTLDTLLRSTKLRSHTIDSYMYKAGAAKFHTIDVLLRKTRSVSHTLDTVFSKRFTRTHTLDTFLKKRVLKTHTIDSILKKRFTRTHTLDTFIRKTRVVSHTLDTILRKSFTRTHTVDTFLKKRTVRTHTIDVFLRKTNTRTHTLSTVLKKLFTRTHTIDTTTKRVGVRSHTVDTLLLKRSLKTHTLDTVLFKPKFVQHSVDTVFRFSQGDTPIVNTLQDKAFANIIDDRVVVQLSSEKPKFSQPDYNSPVELIYSDKPSFK